MLIYELQVFAEKLTVGRPVLGLDHGLKRTGISMSCAMHNFAVPLYTVATYEIVDKLKQIKKGYNTLGIVLGMPMNMDGTRSQQVDKVLKFAEKLVGLEEPIYLQDERLTSKAAQLTIYNRSASDTRDHIAASFILETTLKAMQLLHAENKDYYKNPE